MGDDAGALHERLSRSKKTAVEANRAAQAAYRQRQKAKLAGLEDQVAELSERLRAVELEKARYKAERDALSQRVDTLQSSGARLPTPDPLVAVEVDDEGAALVAGSIHMLRGPAAAGVTAADCKTVTVDMLATISTESMQQYRTLIEMGAGQPGTLAAQQLTQLVEQMQSMMFYLWPKYTTIVGKSVAEFMKRAGAGDTPKETLKDLPQRLLAVLDLSEEQEQRMIDAHADMMSRLSAIFAKHQMVLMGVNDHQRGPAAYSDGIGTTTVLAAVDEVAEQLQACGAAKTAVMQNYAIKCYTQILSPSQIAKGHLEAQPFIMDTVAVAAFLAAQRAQPEPSGDGVTPAMLAWLRDGVASSEEQQAHGRLSSGHSGEHDGASEAVVPRLNRNPFLGLDSLAQPARSDSTATGRDGSGDLFSSESGSADADLAIVPGGPSSENAGFLPMRH